MTIAPQSVAAIPEGWEVCGPVDIRESDGALMLRAANPPQAGSERGIVTTAPHLDRALSFQAFVPSEACFIAKINQTSKLDQCSNSYHLYCEGGGAYLARHCCVFQTLNVPRDTWVSLRLAYDRGRLRIYESERLRHSVRDVVLTGGYAFLGVKRGHVLLRDVQLGPSRDEAADFVIVGDDRARQRDEYAARDVGGDDRTIDPRAALSRHRNDDWGWLSAPRIVTGDERAVISEALYLIWQVREDLQARYDLSTDAGCIGLLRWWLTAGKNEYDGVETRLIINAKQSENVRAAPAAFPRTGNEDREERHDRDSQIDEGTAVPGMSTSRTGGINVAGYAMGELGIGEDVRAAASAMAAAQVPFCVYDVPIPLGSRTNDRRVDQFISKHPVFDVNLILLPAREILRLVLHGGPSLFGGRYTIAGMQWELPRLPAEWHAVYRVVDEFWAASRYVATALHTSHGVPVLHMPPAVDIAHLPDSRRQELGLPEEPFLFLVVFDGFSTFSRKNPSGAVEAFTRAFARRDRDVRLIVKSMNGRCGGDEWIRLQRLAAADDRIVLIDEVFDRDRLLGLLNCCDCYVSLHRAEGFGRVLAEAMLLGKPVIATNHSGNTDFTHAGTAFLVGGSLVSVRPSEYFCAADQYWCNPDIDHAAEQMQRCLNDEAHRQQVAAAGQDFIRAHYNPQVVGQRYRERLEALARVEPCHGTC